MAGISGNNFLCCSLSTLLYYCANVFYMTSQCMRNDKVKQLYSTESQFYAEPTIIVMKQFLLENMVYLNMRIHKKCLQNDQSAFLHEF